MQDFSSLELFARRDILKGTAAAGLFGFFGGGIDNMPDRPLDAVRDKRFPALVAIVRAQIDSLWCGYQGDDACVVAREILHYADYLPQRIQQGINIALLWLNVYSIRHTGRQLHKLSACELRQLLNQGEMPVCKHTPPRIVWCEDHLLHTAVSGLAMLGRLVIHSRPPARELIGLSWSDHCRQADNTVSIPAPPLANLSEHYDVCVIGSGAGGATAAARLTAEGLRVLVIDTGDFVSPDALIQRVEQPDGSVRLAPPRGDEVLYRLYKGAAGQIAGGLGNVDSKLQLIIPSQRKKIPPKQTINVLQAEVFGGGPYVNNAIHLPMSEQVYESWAERKPVGLPYSQLAALMQSINGELGVNTIVTQNQISDRSERFRQGCEAIGEHVEPLPVAIRENASGCGSDNSVDSFGDHIGGVHPYSPHGANSFLVQAMHNPEPARVSYRTTAKRLRIGRDAVGQLTVAGLDVCRVEAGHRVRHYTVTADQYVVAAGAGASTKLIGHSMASVGLRNRHLGKRFTANVGTAVYAVFDKPIWPSTSGRPEPGVTQCFIVDERTVEQDGKLVKEPTLENWFHFPGTVALALCGWFNEFACVMRKFNHLSMSGAVVPTKVRRSNSIGPCGELNLQLDCEEFELMLQGLRRIARIYFAAATPENGVTLHLPTKAVLMRCGRPLNIRNMDDLEWALGEIKRRGPAFINLLTAHPQGGVSLGEVVDQQTFRVKTDCGEQVDNLAVADASLFPAGCGINPQLTIKALATVSAEQVSQRVQVNPLPVSAVTMSD